MGEQRRDIDPQTNESERGKKLDIQFTALQNYMKSSGGSNERE